MRSCQTLLGKKIRLIALVIAMHALLLIAALTYSKQPAPNKRKPLVIHTVKTHVQPAPVKPRPTPPASTKSPAQNTAKKPTPSPQIKPPSKPTPKKEPAIADKKISTKPPQPQTKTPPPSRAKISDALKKELQESLAKLDTPILAAPKSAPPIRPHSLQIDAPDLSTTQSQYIEQLTAILHNALKLPEIGEVKIQLTLHHDGTVAKLVVLKAASTKNKTYLEMHLPHLICPRLDGEYAKTSEQTFILTFCNE